MQIFAATRPIRPFFPSFPSSIYLVGLVVSIDTYDQSLYSILSKYFTVVVVVFLFTVPTISYEKFHISNVYIIILFIFDACWFTSIGTMHAIALLNFNKRLNTILMYLRVAFAWMYLCCKCSKWDYLSILFTYLVSLLMTTTTTITTITVAANYRMWLLLALFFRFVDLFMCSTHSHCMCSELYFNSLVLFCLLLLLLLLLILFLASWATRSKAALFCFLSL